MLQAAATTDYLRTVGGTGKMVATGGENQAGIGGGNGGSAGTITISGGTVTATGSNGAAAIDKGYSGSSSGSFSTGTNDTTGCAVIYANSISNLSGEWSGIVSRSGSSGPAVVYGSPLTITRSASIPSDKIAIIESDEEVIVAEDVTLTNNGTLYQDYGSTFTKTGTYTDNGTTYYEIKDNTSGSGTSPTIDSNGVNEYSSKTYSSSGTTVTVIPAPLSQW